MKKVETSQIKIQWISNLALAPATSAKKCWRWYDSPTLSSSAALHHPAPWLPTCDFTATFHIQLLSSADLRRNISAVLFPVLVLLSLTLPLLLSLLKPCVSVSCFLQHLLQCAPLSPQLTPQIFAFTTIWWIDVTFFVVPWGKHPTDFRHLLTSPLAPSWGWNWCFRRKYCDNYWMVCHEISFKIFKFSRWFLLFLQRPVSAQQLIHLVVEMCGWDTVYIIRMCPQRNLNILPSNSCQDTQVSPRTRSNDIQHLTHISQQLDGLPWNFDVPLRRPVITLWFNLSTCAASG